MVFTSSTEIILCCFLISNAAFSMFLFSNFYYSDEGPHGVVLNLFFFLLFSISLAGCFWEVLWYPDSWFLYDLFLLFENFGYFLPVMLWNSLTSLSLCLFFFFHFNDLCHSVLGTEKNIFFLYNLVLFVTSIIQMKNIMKWSYFFPPSLSHFFDFLRDLKWKNIFHHEFINDLYKESQNEVLFFN